MLNASGANGTESCNPQLEQQTLTEDIIGKTSIDFGHVFARYGHILKCVYQLKWSDFQPRVSGVSSNASLLSKPKHVMILPSLKIP